MSVINIKELHILVGLPGAGKTSFAWDKSKDMFSITVLDFDKIKQLLDSKENKFKSPEDRIKFLRGEIACCYPRNITYVDGFFHCQNDYKLIVSLFAECKDFNICNIIFDYWEPNVDSCIWNDRGKRNVSSTCTIKSINLEKPDLKFFVDNYPEIHSFQIHHHVTVRKPVWQVFFNEMGVNVEYNQKELKSYHWTISGINRDFEGNEWPIIPDEPLEFNEFDNLLEKICPQITFLQYKRIHKECVAIKEDYDSDYYSCCTINYWSCDLEKLYNCLLEKNLITEPV